jgi:hypothetical protein
MWADMKKSTDFFWDSQMNKIQSGVQRRSAFRKRFRRAAHQHLLPVLVSDLSHGNKVTFATINAIPSPKGKENESRFAIGFVVLDKQCRLLRHDSTVVISFHAMWRVIQYFRIRDFSRVDDSLKRIFRVLVDVVVGDLDLKEGVMLVDENNDVLGYMPFVNDGEFDIGVTWVGNRSINEHKLTQFRAEILETVQQADA